MSLHTSDLADYTGKNARLAGDVRGAANDHLGNVSLPADLFGDLGHETPLHATVAHHLGQMHKHTHSVAGSVHDLGHAVHGAKNDYEADQDLHAGGFKRLLPEQG